MMKEKEKQLFKALCKFQESSLDEELLQFATPSVLGCLFFNRMQGIAYDVLRKHNVLGKVNREFRNSLAAAYEQNVQKNRSFYQCISMLSRILSACNCNVAMLKGAYLCAHYPSGYRTSNDVDLLVLPKDVTAIGNLLTGAGFVQGNIHNGELIPATRYEIIESKMMRGETVPYIKEVNLPFMKFFEVDINFSLGYKAGDERVLTDMLFRGGIKQEKGLSIPTLDDADFFLHLCSHLYKEATTLPWIKMHRDMTLYKYCDIYMLLSEMSEDDIQRVFCRSREIEMEKICAYAVLETLGLFDIENDFIYQKALTVISEEPNFCLKVVSPKDRKVLCFQTADVSDRFFMENRIDDLKEISNEKA
ncbi:MAG: nucleotidyltransferase family protein [Clostridia bacterium]|nr:nucleotidyltransferase family protein [Clostridia bacterium]